MRWAPSGRLFATGGADRKLKLWEAVNGKCESRGVLTGSNGALMSVEFDYEENVVIAASSDFAFRVWTISNHRLQVSMNEYCCGYVKHLLRCSCMLTEKACSLAPVSEKHSDISMADAA